MERLKRCALGGVGLDDGRHSHMGCLRGGLRHNRRREGQEPRRRLFHGSSARSLGPRPGGREQGSAGGCGTTKQDMDGAFTNRATYATFPAVESEQIISLMKMVTCEKHAESILDGKLHAKRLRYFPRSRHGSLRGRGVVPTG